jgi:hypothetical protein
MLFNKEDLSKFLRDELLAAGDQVDWILDANTIIGRSAEKFLTSDQCAFTTPEVVSEVRKRPECRGANSFIDKIKDAGRVKAGEEFGEPFKLIEACALADSFVLQNIKNADPNMPEEKAVELAAREGDFLESDLQFLKSFVEIGLLSESDLKIDSSVRRAWFRHPAKRRNKEAIGRYLFSDEKLAAIAVANAVVNARPTVIVSNDFDLAAIMKNVNDNLVFAHALKLNQRLDTGEPIIGVADAMCRTFDDYQKTQARLKESVVPSAFELTIYRPGAENEAASYFYPYALAEFVNSRS